MEKAEMELSQLSFDQKLALMEALWEDLSKEEERLESPAWHETILKDREKAYSDGKITVSDWEEAKEKIKRKISCK